MKTVSNPSQSPRSQIRSFPPIASENSKVLVLGSMPGRESLRVRQYYAKKGNAFWPIMGELFGAGLSSRYEQRVKLLQSVGVALWDSLRACKRPGSLDAAITEEVPNNFPLTRTRLNQPQAETIGL